MPEYILSLSYGKDSLACLGAIEALGWPLDRIVHAEVWATDTIPADLPPMVEFKARADEIIKARWGITVEHYCAARMAGVCKDKVTFDDMFYSVMVRGKFVGTIRGFPLTRGRWCQDLKTTAINRIKQSPESVQYVGIAADEPNRFGVLSDRKRSPLVEAGWTEAMCRDWCADNDLLSPIYTTATRGGCWFCPCQGIDQLRILRRDYPELWALLLKWDAESPVSFRADGRTVHDYDRRFRWEDEGSIPNDRRFRWDWLDKGVQLRLEIPTIMQDKEDNT